VSSLSSSSTLPISQLSETATEKFCESTVYLVKPFELSPFSAAVSAD